ncbi:MAG: serine/threonine-protein kinase, partial [Planctomycetes bacterium]|nr:serine/threonine-protein kinase [Planctomycetota bacterium]
MDQCAQINRRYSLRAAISTGPGGVVHIAEDLLRPNEPLALKVLPPGTFDEGARHLEELARITALRHPNLNPVLDFGRIKRVAAAACVPPRGPAWERALPRIAAGSVENAVPAAGSLYLASRFLSGGNLMEVLPRIIASGMEPEHLDRWLSGVTLQVLRAIRFLHDLSLLHFDIKPEHVLLADDEEYTSGVPHAYLIDLGLTARESTPLGNRVRGTFPYIAPEVLDRSIVDHRVDLYSLGATLYHALAGGLMLKDRSSDELLALVHHGHLPPPGDFVRGLPAFWNDCILRLMQHDPEQRYPSAASVIESIRKRPAAAVMEDPPVLIGRSPRLVGQEKEFDYIARELERLKIGESASTLILIHGEEGIGKRMTVRRLIELARLQGIEVLLSRCLGDGESPLDPIGRLLGQLRSHPLTPTALFGEIEQLLRWLRDGIAPAEGDLPTLIERREDRTRMQGRIAELFNALDPVESYFFVIEDLHLAAPEMIDCLALIAHRAHLERTPPPAAERDAEAR